MAINFSTPKKGKNNEKEQKQSKKLFLILSNLCTPGVRSQIHRTESCILNLSIQHLLNSGGMHGFTTQSSKQILRSESFSTRGRESPDHTAHLEMREHSCLKWEDEYIGERARNQRPPELRERLARSKNLSFSQQGRYGTKALVFCKDLPLLSTTSKKTNRLPPQTKGGKTNRL